MNSAVERAPALAAHLIGAGREPSGFPMDSITSYSLGAAQWLQDAQRWSAVGGTYISLRTMDSAAAQLSDAETMVYDMNANAEEKARVPLDLELEFAVGGGI